MAIALFALPLSLVFMTIGHQWSPAGFALGYLLSLVAVAVVNPQVPRLNLAQLPGQVAWSLIYTGQLFWKILLSSVDVAKRVLAPAYVDKSGILAIPVQDKRAIVAALSAHGITVTPGEMVIGFEERRDGLYMLVHCLDLEASSRTAPGDQVQRLQLFGRILGE
jgi:multicomponent Na+:H+ antiporter subunit E